MKNKYIVNFWVGFLLASLTTALIYWLLRGKRQITPAPVILEQKETFTIPSRPEKPSETKREDLTRIKGIGPAYARLLNDNGINSFEDLANARPAKIQEIIGTKRWDPADWVKEASEILNRR